MSVYAINERILAVMWILWGFWIIVPDFSGQRWQSRDILAVIGICMGTVLLIANFPPVRRVMDKAQWAKWPASIRLRQGLHLFLAAFALMIALAVSANDVSQPRIPIYVGIGLIHVGKVLRLLRFNQ